MAFPNHPGHWYFSDATDQLLGDYPVARNAMGYLRNRWMDAVDDWRSKNPSSPPMVLPISVAKTLFRREMKRVLFDTVADQRLGGELRILAAMAIERLDA